MNEFRPEVSRETASSNISHILNNCMLLFQCEIYKDARSRYILSIKTNEAGVKYEEENKDGMMWFLEILKTKSDSDNQENADELMEELEDID